MMPTDKENHNVSALLEALLAEPAETNPPEAWGGPLSPYSPITQDQLGKNLRELVCAILEQARTAEKSREFFKQRVSDWIITSSMLLTGIGNAAAYYKEVIQGQRMGPEYLACCREIKEKLQEAQSLARQQVTLWQFHSKTAPTEAERQKVLGPEYTRRVRAVNEQVVVHRFPMPGETALPRRPLDPE